MPNIVNQSLVKDLEATFQEMGSCVVVEHGAVDPKQDIEIRTQLREAGVQYRLVRTRLAKRALADVSPGLGDSLKGRCGFAIAEEEGAIKAAKILKEWIKKTKDAPIAIRGGVVEGTVYAGDDAQMLAELPDRDTVNTQIVQAISGPARSLASVLNAVAGGMARCIQAKIDKGE
ncbi:MAG: 50S ribosomal protein L10 [bacterium]|nr:50S ribosomal protein L10 [bacterium]